MFKTHSNILTLLHIIIDSTVSTLILYHQELISKELHLHTAHNNTLYSALAFSLKEWEHQGTSICYKFLKGLLTRITVFLFFSTVFYLNAETKTKNNLRMLLYLLKTNDYNSSIIVQISGIAIPKRFIFHYNRTANKNKNKCSKKRTQKNK